MAAAATAHASDFTGIYNFGSYIPDVDTRDTARGFITAVPAVAGSQKYSAAQLR